MASTRLGLALALLLAFGAVWGCDGGPGGDGDGDGDGDSDGDGDGDGDGDADADGDGDADLDGDGDADEDGDSDPGHGLSCDDADFFVAPDGDDDADGTEGAPFATFARARDALRGVLAGGVPEGGAMVCLRGGTYELAATLELGDADSGETDALVQWVSYPGEVVRLSGGRALAPAWFTPVTEAHAGWSRLPEASRSEVVALRLPDHGISDYGELLHRGFGSGGNGSALEVVVDGQVMELARWPNRGHSDPVDPDASAVVEGDIFGAGTTFDNIGTTATGSADDGYPNYHARLPDGRDFYLYHCTWEWGGAEHHYWFLSEADPRTGPDCWPSGRTSWLHSGDDRIPPLDPLGGSASEVVVARNRPIDYAEHGFLRIPEALDDRSFRFPGERYLSWSAAEDIWFQGLFHHYWADDTLPGHLEGDVVRLDEETSYGVSMDMPFFAQNLLEELDTAGEYYVDRDDGTLYLWPPTDLAGAEVHVTMLEEPLLRLDGAHHLEVVGITFEHGRWDLVDVNGARAIRFAYCTFRNGGRDGLDIEGADSGIERCLLHGLGARGVTLEGGDRPSLTPGNDYARDSVFHDFSRWERTYRPAIGMAGCGQIAEHNLIYDAPHSAILYGGNDHRIEYNDIGYVVLEANDAGAIYTGRDWGYRGNQIRFNFIHHVESIFGGSHGVYLDDCVSGFTVTGNIFFEINGIAMMSGGGRDNHFEHNIVVAASRAAHHSDRRGQAAANDSWSGGHPDSWNLLGRINVVYSGPGRGDPIDHQAGPWATRYPELAVVPDDWGAIAGSHWLDPEGCVFARNLVDRSGGLMSEGTWGGDGAFDSYDDVGGNLEDVDPLFVDEAGGDFSLRPESPALTIPGFADIPFDEIGPRP